MSQPRCRGLRAVWPAAGLFALIILLPACSGGLQTVKGKVTQKGTPLKGAIVFFHPADGSTPATGVADAEGVYSLSTGTTSGAAPGEYKVTIRWPAEPDPSKAGKIPNSSDAPLPPDRLMGKYGDPKTTKLRATVNRGSNDVPFDLD